MRSPLATAIAIGFGLVTLLLAYILPGLLPGFADVRALILGWAVNLAAVATLIAIFSLVSVHLRKANAGRNPDRYSYFTLLFFLITFLAGCLVYGLPALLSGLGLDQTMYQRVFVQNIQTPVETSLMAVLAVTLTLACFRLFQRRRGIIAVSFLLSALVFLLFNSGIVSMFEGLLPSDLLGSLLGFIQLLPIAGGRGILLGIALGSIMVGLRIIFGTERPYSG